MSREGSWSLTGPLGPPKNICTPENEFGGFDHYLFLGCSIMAFSASAGWDSQSSELTIQLVEDPCAPPAGRPKKYYDTCLNLQDWTQADPGFYGESGSIIGASAYFRVEDFEFCGLIQNWERKNAADGNPVYEVKLVDPSFLLKNSQVILDKWAGSTAGLTNVFNAYGYMEYILGLYNGDGTCPQVSQITEGLYNIDPTNSIGPDFRVFGSPAGYFGRADKNENGMTWRHIVWALEDLVSGPTATKNNNKFSGYRGRIVFRDYTAPAEGMGLFGNGEYLLDLEDIPNGIQVGDYNTDYIRFEQSHQSILDIVEKVCRETVHDFYVELVPVKNDPEGDSCPLTFIKVRTVDRNDPPIANAIDTYVDNNVATNKKIINYNKGKELRNEVTQAMLMGGQIKNIYQASNNMTPGVILPYMGLDPTTGNVLEPTLDNTGWWVWNLPVAELNQSLSPLGYSVTGPYITVHEKELLAAKIGFDGWQSWASVYGYSFLYNALNLSIKGLWEFDRAWNMHLNGKVVTPDDNVHTSLQQFHVDVGERAFSALQVIHSWLSKYVNTYYGKQFQVGCPFVCATPVTARNAESGKLYESSSPTDAGWTEMPTVLDLSGSPLDFFRTEDGRIQAFVGFVSNQGFSGSVDKDNVNDIVIINNKAWMKASVESEFVYADAASKYQPRAVVTINSQLRMPGSTSHKAIPLLISNFDGQGGLTTVPLATQMGDTSIKRVNSTSVHESYVSRPMGPVGAAVPMQSNVMTYGPWGAVGAEGGEVIISSEDGLVPWEFKGLAFLETAALTLVNNSVSNQQVVEGGSVTVVGYPNVPLGAELLAAQVGNPFYNSTGKNLYENRTIRVVNRLGAVGYAVDVQKWDGSYGPNITGVTTQVNPSGLQTTYNMKIWTTKFGNFARVNAERLKKLGQHIWDTNRYIRAFALHQRKFIESEILKHAGPLAMAMTRPDFIARWGRGSSPSGLAVGDIKQEGDYIRTNVGFLSLHESVPSFAEDWHKKSGGGLETFFRPVSWKGANGELPAFGSKAGALASAVSLGAQPPIDASGFAGDLDQYNLDVDTNFLNPVSNPGSDLVLQRSDTNIGHDMEKLAKLTTPNDHGLHMNHKDGIDYQSDYRLLALRGPLLMQGWGYDLDGFPVPNSVDTYSAAKAGNFVEAAKTHKFLDNFLRRSDTWPCGPIDLRWDRQRACWTVPQLRLLVAELLQDIEPFQFGNAKRIDTEGPQLYKTDGANLDDAELVAWDKVGIKHCQGDKVIVYFDPFLARYHIVESLPSIKGTNSEDCPTKETWYYRELEFGKGLKVGSNNNQCGKGLVSLEMQVDTVMDAAGITLGDCLVANSVPSGNCILAEIDVNLIYSADVVTNITLDPCGLHIEKKRIYLCSPPVDLTSGIIEVTDCDPESEPYCP